MMHASLLNGVARIPALQFPSHVTPNLHVPLLVTSGPPLIVLPQVVVPRGLISTRSYFSWETYSAHGFLPFACKVQIIMAPASQGCCQGNDFCIPVVQTRDGIQTREAWRGDKN